MKVAILHDWLTGFRGGERVLEVFCEMYPEADLYTLIYQPGSTSKIIENRTIHTSFLDKIPGIYKHYRKFLPLFPLAAMSLKIPEDVGLVISSSHCVIKGVKKPSHAKHISYIHSPMRYLYDQYDTYFGPSAPFYQRLGAKVFKNYLVNWDKNSNSNVDVPIANARFVQQRIKKYYQIESGVIHPFVDLKDFQHIQENSIEKEDFYIMVTAFAPNKRVDLAIRAFNKNGKKLKIIGSGQQEKELKEMAKSNIEFLGNVSREEVVTYFSKAKALIFPGTEDFGITPLESLAAGTPVIAFQYGGVLETLNDQVAVFFKEQSNESLEKAIEEFELKVFEKETLLQRANDFSRENFKNNIANLIKETLEGSNG